MSGEFGSYNTTGYMDEQIRTAADDCASGQEEITKLWGKVLEEIYPIARDICRSEAADASVAETIFTSMEQIPRIKARIAEIEKSLETYRAVMYTAVRNHERKAKG